MSNRPKERTMGLTQSPNGITIKSPEEVELMRQAGKVVAHAIAALERELRPGMKTKDLDAIAAEVIRSHGAKPSFLGYRGFPATICVSINEEIVHGIPGDKVINDGDMVSVDVGAIIEGFHGDSAKTFGAGDVSPQVLQLMDVTRQSLKAGIAAAQPGARVGDISAAVQEFAESRNYSVVKEYVGHGIGRALHEEPQIPNYGPPGRGPLLRTGMVIAIEPMVNIGEWQTRPLDDGWTVVTADGSLSAHFEHTLAILENGPEVLTRI